MKFSIITVCFNSAKTIRRTFDSLLAQNYTDYEYIVIDGLSKDGTIDIIKEYEPKFNGRMRWISEKDSGIYDAMNKGLALAKGDYINMMNSDDWFEENALAELAKIPGSPDVIYGCTFLVDPIYNSKDLRRIDHHRLPQKMIFHQSCFVAKRMHDIYGKYDARYKISADYDFFLKMYLNGADFQATNILVANFQKGGISGTNTWVLLKEYFSIRCKHNIISKSAMRRGIFSTRVLYLIEQMFIKTAKFFSFLHKKNSDIR